LIDCVAVTPVVDAGSPDPCLPCTISIMSVFCVHLVIYQQLAAEQLLERAGRQYVKAGGTAHPSQYKLSPHPPPPDRQGRAPCWVNSHGLRPLR
jgi:hypothetical protein